MLVIVDYGVGNLGSLYNMFSHIGVNVCISSNIKVIKNAEKLILPGVGSFDAAINKLNELKLIPTLNNFVLDQKKPILGICLGMQLMTQNSEEGNFPGLSYIKAYTKKIPISQNIKVPHMGWNNIKIKKSSKLFREISNDQRFYFANSYYVDCVNSEDVIAEVDYGTILHVAFNRENIYGVQFHPEKSHKFGMALLKNFVFL